MERLLEAFRRSVAVLEGTDLLDLGLEPYFAKGILLTVRRFFKIFRAIVYDASHLDLEAASRWQINIYGLCAAKAAGEASLIS